MVYKTNIYVDAFNFYYGCTKDTPYKWVNLAVLFDNLLTNSDINEIKVFAGKVKPRPHDLNQPQRQQLYFRALNTIPNITLIYGSFITSKRWYPKAKSAKPNKPEFVQV